MADASVTRYELSIDPASADATTGWPPPTYTEIGEIDGSIQNRGYTFIVPNFGAVTAKYAKTFFTADVIAGGDLVKDAWSRYYVIKSVEPVDRFNQFLMYQCECDRRDFAAPTTTSGIWHLDNDSLKTDPRYRHKLWLDTYLTAGNMKLDGDVFNADVDTMFADIPYYCPAEQLFVTEDVDGVMAINKRGVDNLVDYNHYPYGFIETVPIHCSAVDKAGLTATNLLEQMVQEIRHVATDHPVAGSSLRDIDSTEYKSTDIGGARLWETTVTVKYKHCNDDYVPTYPRITWGPSAAPTGTFYFPNCVEISPPLKTDDSWIKPRRFTGNLVQVDGCNAIDYRIKCDLDLDNTAYTWKRPQTTTPKTDKVNYEVFLDLLHNEGIDQDYHTLTLSAVGPSHQVRLVSMEPELTGDGNKITLVFREYRSTSAGGGTYKTRFGISA